METSMTVTDILAKEGNRLTLRCYDMNLDEWTVDFRFAPFYAEHMAVQMGEDLAAGVQPFLTCGYNEERDVFIVSDDHGTEVMLSRFENWNRI